MKVAKQAAWIVSFLLIPLAGLSALWLLAGFSLQESVYCQRGSLDYFWGITERVIKYFPTPDLTGVPEFHWGRGDGPKPPDQSVYFDSQAAETNLLATALKHIKQCGFHPTKATNGHCYFTNGSKYLYLGIVSENGITKVHAELTP